MKTKIIYEDNDVLVVHKPAGLATQTARVGQQDVVSELKNYLAQSGKKQEKASQPYLGIIHRLDQPVEGLLVFARNKKSAAGLSSQLQKQGGEAVFSKHYYAVVCGLPEEKQGKLENYLYKNKDNRAIVVDNPLIQERDAVRARRAVLQYCILQTSDTEKIALVDISIETGRFHQIRAQMAHHGMPLLGDLKYGNGESIEKSNILQIRNTALCAYSLEFIHPALKKKMSYEVKPEGKAFSFFTV